MTLTFHTRAAKHILQFTHSISSHDQSAHTVDSWAFGYVTFIVGVCATLFCTVVDMVFDRIPADV